MGNEGRVPNLFIIGAPKCGTTSLFWYLGEHPDIFVPNNKEPNFFIYDSLVKNVAHTTKLRRAVKSLDDYLNLYIEAHNEKYVMDGSIFTYFFEDGLKKLKALSPDYKAVFLLRNPVERFISHYKMCVNLGEIKKPIDVFMDDPFAGMGVNMLELGLYSREIKKTYEILKPERIHIILLDDMKKDVEKVLMALYDFLGIERALPANKEKVFLRSPGVARNAKIRNIYIKSGFFRILKRVFRKTPLYKLKKLINRRLYRDMPIPTEVKQKLHAYYEKDIAELEKMLGRDLGIWRIDEN